MPPSLKTARPGACVALQCDATPLAREGQACETAQARCLARFPDAGVTFDLGDFSIVVLQPGSARIVAGFGRAHGLVGDALQARLRGTG